MSNIVLYSITVFLLIISFLKSKEKTKKALKKAMEGVLKI